MRKLYTWTTPNGRKVSIALEEMGLDYDVVPVNITKDEQFEPHFLSLNPNNKIPVLVDDDRVINESNVILLYLAEQTGRFTPDRGTGAWWEMVEWLTWQAAGFGPMLGQVHHFSKFNAGLAPYAENRFHTEARRLYGVLNGRLARRDHVVGDLSIADFAIWPWVSRFEWQRIDLDEYPAVRDWYLRLADRPGFQRGYAEPADVGPIPRPQ